MTTNTNPRTPARFYATDKPFLGMYQVIDRTDGKPVTSVKGRAAARNQATLLSAIDPAPRDERVIEETTIPAPKKARKAKAAKAEPKVDAVRTSHADCKHASSKLARAICRRERSKAATA